MQGNSVRHRQGRGAALTELLGSLIEGSADFEGAVLVSDEGLVMAAAWPQEELDDSDVGAVATRAFELSDQATGSLERGDLERLILLGSEGNMIIMRAGPSALCVVMLKPNAKIGIASFEAGRISKQMAEVLG